LSSTVTYKKEALLTDTNNKSSDIIAANVPPVSNEVNSNEAQILLEITNSGMFVVFNSEKIAAPWIALWQLRTEFKTA
jgi:hypothetical protein